MNTSHVRGLLAQLFRWFETIVRRGGICFLTKLHFSTKAVRLTVDNARRARFVISVRHNSIRLCLLARARHQILIIARRWPFCHNTKEIAIDTACRKRGKHKYATAYTEQYVFRTY